MVGMLVVTGLARPAVAEPGAVQDQDLLRRDSNPQVAPTRVSGRGGTGSQHQCG
jgi:hypothetical protein